MRQQLTLQDVDVLLESVRSRTPIHLQSYGAGIFTHPHEIVGCMYGQLMKLSTAADASIYTGDLTEFKERCMKTLMAIIVGTCSADKLIELRRTKRDK